MEIVNPVLRGFAPDPSMIRVKDDYYIATSTFEWWPGVKLWHSADLKTWTRIGSPLTRQSQLMMEGLPNNCGIWAPDLAYHEGGFYLTYTVVRTQKRPYYNTPNYIVRADDINGPWSEPVYITSTGFDPSLFFDDDGRLYFVNMHNQFKGIFLTELDPRTLEKLGPEIKLIDSDYSLLSEGPHIYKENGFYYLIIAEGGTGYEHRVSQLRARSLSGPWERNPVPVISSEPGDRLQKCGHGSIVGVGEGKYVLAVLSSRPYPGTRLCPLGRETSLFPLKMENGWFVLENGESRPYGRVLEPDEDDDLFIRFDSPLSDFFVSLRKPIGSALSLSARPGFLRLYGQDSVTSGFDVSLLAVPVRHFSYRASAEMYFEPEFEEQNAGLVFIYNNENLIGALIGKDTIKIQRFEKGAFKEHLFPFEGTNGLIRLEITVEGFNVSFSVNGEKLPLVLDSSNLTDEKAPGFTGAHMALYCHDMTGGRGYADFSAFSLSRIR